MLLYTDIGKRGFLQQTIIFFPVCSTNSPLYLESDFGNAQVSFIDRIGKDSHFLNISYLLAKISEEIFTDVIIEISESNFSRRWSSYVFIIDLQNKPR